MTTSTTQWIIWILQTRTCLTQVRILAVKSDWMMWCLSWPMNQTRKRTVLQALMTWKPMMTSQRTLFLSHEDLYSMNIGSPLLHRFSKVSYHDCTQSCTQLPAYLLMSGSSCHVIIICWCISSHLTALHPYTLAHHSQFVTSTLLSLTPFCQACSREIWGG